MRSVTTDRTTPQPVSLSEAKDQLGYAQSDGSSDTRIKRVIIAATRQWEDDTQTATTPKGVTEDLPVFPPAEWRLYWRPVISVDSIMYYDEAGDQQTLSTDVYSVDLPNRKIYLNSGESWPALYDRYDAVRIAYVAGKDLQDEIAKQAILIQIDIMEELRGTTKEKDASVKLYENLVIRYERGSYP